MAEYLIIGLTLAVAIVGILWKQPSRLVQIILILFAAATSAASIYKLMGENEDKKFLQLALTSTLVPSNSDYTRFYSDFNAPAAARGFDVRIDYPCHHTPEGLTCFLANSDASKHGTLVLNKGEVATMYANLIRGAGNGSTSEAFFKKQYTPSVHDEEFLDKVGIVGLHTFYNMYHSFPRTYDYDDSFGVYVKWENAGKDQFVQISPDDISRIPHGSGFEVFRKIEELYRERFELATRAAGKGSSFNAP